MARKLILLAFSLALFVSASFAQQKSANFLGTWKLAESENNSKAGKTTITVTETGKDLIIERNHQKAGNAETYSFKTSYKISGATTTKLIAGQFGGVEITSLRFLKDNKLQLLKTMRTDPDLQTVVGSTPSRETWTLSEDGKTLTVKIVARYASSKMVFVKE